MKYLIFLILLSTTCFASEFFAGQKVRVSTGFYEGCTGYVSAIIQSVETLYVLDGVYCRNRPSFNVKVRPYEIDLE